MSDYSQSYYGNIFRLEYTDDTTAIEFEPNIVYLGSPYHLQQETHVTKRGKEYERVIVYDDRNRAVGFVPRDVAKRIIQLFDEGWLCHVVPMLVGFSKKTRSYWVEVAVLCYKPELQAALDPFLEKFGQRVASGDHVNPRLSEKQLEELAEHGVKGFEIGLAPLPNLKPDNSAIYKSGLTNTQKLANYAVKHTTGCYIYMAIATVIVVAFVVWLVFFR